MTNEEKKFLSIHLWGMYSDLDLLQMHLDRKRDEMEDKIQYYIGTIKELIAKVSDEYHLELFADDDK